MEWLIHLYLSHLHFQIAVRANYLEVENEKLKEQLKLLRQENLTLRSQVAASADRGDHVAHQQQQQQQHQQ